MAINLTQLNSPEAILLQLARHISKPLDYLVPDAQLAGKVATDFQGTLKEPAINANIELMAQEKEMPLDEAQQQVYAAAQASFPGFFEMFHAKVKLDDWRKEQIAATQQRGRGRAAPGELNTITDAATLGDDLIELGIAQRENQLLDRIETLGVSNDVAVKLVGSILRRSMEVTSGELGHMDFYSVRGGHATRLTSAVKTIANIRSYPDQLHGEIAARIAGQGRAQST